MRRFFLYMLHAVGLLSLSLCVWGQDVSRTVHTQQNARVVARRHIKVIKPMELSGRELNGYRIYKLADAVRYYSGLLFKDYEGMTGLKTINLRSMGSERINVFYNGVEVSNGYSGQVDLSRFTLDNVGNLSLYSGQKGDIFQSATDFASAGSLYITTRRPLFKGESRTNFKAGLRGGSTFMINPSVLYEHDLGNYIYTSANAEFLASTGAYPFRYRRYSSDGDLIYDLRDHRENGDIYASRAEASVNGIFDRGIWSVFLYHFGSNRGIPGPIVNNEAYNGERLTERNSFLQGNLRMDIVDGYRTQVSFKFSHDYTRYVNEDDKLLRVDDSFHQYEAYVSNSHLYVVSPDLDLTAAYDVKFNVLTKFDETQRRPSHDLSRPSQLMNLLALAAQYSIGRVQMQGSVLGTLVNSFERKGFSPYGDKMALTPSFLVSYTPWRRVDFSLQAYVKQTYRLPNYNDRYVADVRGERLLPENMLQYSVGTLYSQKLDVALREYGMTAEAYFHDVRNKIIGYPQGRLFRWSMVNLGRVYIAGGDVMSYARYRAMGELDITARLQYRYQQAIDVTDEYDTYYKHQIPYVPVHSGSAAVNMDWHGWTLNYSFLYVGKRHSRQENISYYELQPWYTHDVSLIKHLPLGDWNIRMMAEVNNVFGQDYEIVTNYPVPKQTFRLTVTAEL